MVKEVVVGPGHHCGVLARVDAHQIDVPIRERFSGRHGPIAGSVRRQRGKVLESRRDAKTPEGADVAACRGAPPALISEIAADADRPRDGAAVDFRRESVEPAVEAPELV